MTHENVPDFSTGNYERRSSKLADENAKYAEFYLKEAIVIYGFYLLAARLPELTSKFERLDCSPLFNSEHRSKLSTDLILVGYTELSRFNSLRRTEPTKQASVTTLHVSVV